MKKIIYLVCAFILAWGCTREPQELTEKGMREKSSFSIDEAKLFFEKHMSSALATRSTGNKNGFIPGDFTVDWAATTYSDDQTHCNMELSINAQYRFRVMRAEEINGVITAYSVPVYQKLVMVKNLKTDKVSNYVMTLIPDHRYAQIHRNFDPQSFSVYGDHAGFSGLIVYSTLENVSRPVQVCIFRDGRKKADYSIFKEPAKRAENFASIVRTLRGIEVVRKAHVATRSGEDDWWDDEIVDGGVIDPVVIVPDDTTWIDPVEIIGKPDGPTEGADGMTNDEWLDASKPGGEVEPDGTTPDQDVNIGYEGDEDGDPTSPSTGDSSKSIEKKKELLKSALDDKIENIMKHVSIKTGQSASGTLASSTMNLRDIFNNTDLIFTINPNLSDIQLSLVLAHEFMHLALLEISRNAGSAGVLAQTNQELLADLNQSGINEGHHNYMGSHIDDMETLLRDCFPGQSEDFYECGKWGGGAFNSDEYNQLPPNEQITIEDYLINNGLMQK